MFITNGFQAFSDYSTVREDLYVSTLYDRKSIPSFEPYGRVLISVNATNWVLDIHSTYESRLLALSLTRYFICSNGGDRSSTSDVERALSKIASFGIQVRRITPIIADPQSFIHDFRFEQTIKAEKIEKNIVLETVVSYLRALYLQTNDIDLTSLIAMEENGVGYIDNSTLYHRHRGKHYLIIVVGSSLYLTNLTMTDENIDKIKIALANVATLKSGFRSISKGFDHIAFSTISRLVKRNVNIRPALLLPKDGGGYNLIHRPFLGTEKTFEDTRRHIHLAAKALSQSSVSMND